MKEKCLDFATTLFGLEEETIEEDFKAVDSDKDGKATLEEGMKAYEYFRDNAGKFGMCIYECCPNNSNDCEEFKDGPIEPCGVCDNEIEKTYADHCIRCTLKATQICDPYPDCRTANV